MRTVVIVLLARCAVAAVCVAQPTGVRERECAWESTFGSRLLCTICPGLAPTLAGDGCSEFRWSQEAACTGHATWPQSTNGRGGVEAGAATGNEATIKVRRSVRLSRVLLGCRRQTPVWVHVVKWQAVAADG